MKKQTKIGILLLTSPLIIICISIVTSLFINTGEISNILKDIFLYLLLIVSPILFGIGIYLLIRSRDKDDKFINNKVSKKRKLIGKIILFGIICPIFLFFIGYILYASFVENMESEIRKEYYSKCMDQLLQKCDYQNNNKEEYELEPTLIGNYDFVPDEYVWNWDMDEYGYFFLNRYIDIPSHYIPKKTYTLKESWNLKNNYPLELNCNPIDVKNLEEDTTYKCSISYNGKVISTNVRHDIFCLYPKTKSCYDLTGVALYSNKYTSGNEEYLFLISDAGETLNDLSVYRLDNGEYLPLMFKYEYKGENFSKQTYIISSTKFELYGVGKYGMFDKLMDGDMELVTFFTEPTMGVYNNIYGIYSIWAVERDGLYLRKSVMELIQDWETKVGDGV